MAAVALGHPVEPPRPMDWASANRCVVAAGTGWVRAALTGEEAACARQGLQAARAALTANGRPAAMDQLVQIFALSEAEEDCLWFALAHRIDGAVAGLCAAAVGDPRQSFVTAHLLTTVLGGDDSGFRHSLFERLLPNATLRRHALLELTESHALAALTLPDHVTHWLLGARDGIRLHGVTALPELPLPVRLERLAASLASGPARALAGPSGSGRRAVASRLAEHAGRRAVLVDPATLAAGDGRIAALATSARLAGLTLVVDGDAARPTPGDGAVDGSAAGHRLAALVGALLDLELDAAGLVVIQAEGAAVDPRLATTRLEPLSVAEREALWAAVFGRESPTPEMTAVAAQFPLGPSAIATIAAAVGPAPPPGALWRRCRDRGGDGLAALATRVAPRAGWDDLVLPAAVTEELRAIADQLRHRATVYEDWGFARRLAAGRGIVALFAGSSGVGKTMAAEVIAGELGLDLYKVDLSRLVSKYIGETEKNLRRVFDAAEDAGACLFLDEADACLGKRSEVRDSHDRHANIEVSYLLQRLESYAGLCLLATNLKNNLDPAFLRRLRFVVDIPFPDQGQRLRIWERAFPAATPTSGLDFVALSRLDIAGGSIVLIAVNAAFLAAAEGGPVTMARIARAARGEFRKHDRIFRPTW